MKRLWILWASSLVVPCALAQEVQRPAYVVGEWCEYAVDGVGRTMHRQEVVEVAPDGGVTIRFKNDEREELRVYNAQLEEIRRGTRELTWVSRTAPRFPLGTKSVGTESKHSRAHPRRSTMMDLTTVTKSVEPETVQVPAGTFSTLRAEYDTRYRCRDGSCDNRYVNEVWRATDPKIKFPVKMITVDYGSRNGRITFSMVKCGSEQPKK